MHEEIEAEQLKQSGWFPTYSIRFEKVSDILFLGLVIGLVLIALLCILVEGKRAIKRASASHLFDAIQLTVHVYMIFAEVWISVTHFIQSLHVSWYPIAALTIIPMTVDIPRWMCVPYLLLYCIVNIWAVAQGIIPPQKQSNDTPTAVKQETVPSSKDTKAATATGKHLGSQATRQSNSHLFTGMRITIQ